VARALDQTEDIPALTGHVPRGNPTHLALGAGAPTVALLH
jgi:hypothetical protein